MAGYLVTTPTEKRLVEAKTAAAAIRHVIKDTVTAKNLSTSEILKLINEGVKPEIASAEQKEEAEKAA